MLHAHRELDRRLADALGRARQMVRAACKLASVLLFRILFRRLLPSSVEFAAPCRSALSASGPWHCLRRKNFTIRCREYIVCMKTCVLLLQSRLCITKCSDRVRIPRPAGPTPLAMPRARPGNATGRVGRRCHPCCSWAASWPQPPPRAAPRDADCNVLWPKCETFIPAPCRTVPCHASPRRAFGLGDVYFVPRGYCSAEIRPSL